MTTSIPTFQEMSNTARLMRTALYGTETEGPNPVLCREEAKKLHKLGLQLITAELKGEFQLTDTLENSVLPIVTEIEKVISYPGFQDSVPLVQTLSKVYRVFIELRWYQPWRAHEKMPVLLELKQQFLDTTKKLKNLMKSKGPSATGTLFELRCAKRAAMRLDTPAPTWGKYVFHVGSVVAAAVDGSCYDALQALRALAEDLKKDCPHKWSTWYQVVHVMRWDRLSIQTLEDFERKIAPQLGDCFEKGGNQSLCLAKVSKELVKHGEDEAVRDRSFQVLVDLAQKEKIPGAHEIKHHPQEFVRKIARKPDRFGETRILAMQYLSKIAANKNQCGNYEKYQKSAEDALNQRKNYLESNQSKKYQKEVQEINQTIQDICAERNKAEKRRDEIEPQIDQLKNPTKNDVKIEFDTVEEAIKEWERLDDVAEKAQKQENALKEELGYIQEVSVALSANEKAEKEHLTVLLSGEGV